MKIRVSLVLAGLVAAAVVAGVLVPLPSAEAQPTPDSNAEVDLNLVMTDNEELIEIQGTAEGKPFAKDLLEQMLEYGMGGARQIFEAQRACLEGAL